MEINIIEDDLIGNIRNEFRRQYPYLKLQFYKMPHQEGEASPKTEQLQVTLPIEDVTMFHTGAQIDISPARTVAEVEYDFFHKLGLCVQILRQSGSLWLTTTDTDHWTLQEQNNKGSESMLPLKHETPEDYDLQDID